ncbi:PadR family transcriptional regulator [Halorubrum sp. GN11_10-6_MGM]|uniref:helix-turn-helix transcriptional regulator n=1 Tax=Halorubrum sp. GN11_10-6_MGM TaxID=2518112 RepID=UPI0010F59A05|nr:helix-turn-helix transcriptional regulator [Halorubrum sp. GN11_10-6_MGM]TKX72367.1 PadR family transcriptional regulator [Halorubrum sp. GN11_10-6_MGM]
MNSDLGTAKETEPRELVHFVTQQTRFALIMDILQHPKQLPSMYELEELNPSVSEATVYKHIQKLIDAGIVKEVPLNDDQRRQGYPRKFYGLTEEGRTFLDEHNLLAAEETLQQIHKTISDKPEKMIKYENAPRPDGA